MNFVDSQLSTPPYPTFPQFISALNNHKLRLSCYDEDKKTNQNLAFISFKGERGKSHGCGRGLVHGHLTLTQMAVDYPLQLATRTHKHLRSIFKFSIFY